MDLDVQRIRMEGWGREGRKEEARGRDGGRKNKRKAAWDEKSHRQYGISNGTARLGLSGTKLSLSLKH